MSDRKDFFISYNKADKAWAEWIAWQLKEAGYSVVIQAWHFVPGSDFTAEMQRALTDCERTVAVLSPDYLSSEYATKEWLTAFGADPLGWKRRVKPIRVRKCSPEALLRGIVYVDLVGVEDRSEAKSRVLSITKDDLTPNAEPAFPGASPTSSALISAEPEYPGASTPSISAPAKLPSIWNVPHQRNRNFTGRDELLRELEESLGSGSPAALTQAIHGLGGVGKTQMAVEYAYSHTADYDAVLWLAAEDPTTLPTSFAGLAQEIGLDVPTDAPQPQVADAVRGWLRNGGKRWLLVFDNAEEVAHVRPFLPPAGTGHVLITSRNRAWGGVARPLPVPLLSSEDSREFLLARTAQTDEAAAGELAEELGYLALALEQAGAYIEQHGTPLADYLGLVRRHRAEILARGLPADYPDTVATTWLVSIRKVEESSPAAVDLLRLLSFFAPEEVPLDTLLECSGVLPEPLRATFDDELHREDALAALQGHSLLERAENGLSMHRLVQVVTRVQLNQANRKRWTNVAARLVEKWTHVDAQDPRNWPLISKAMPHLLAVVERCEEEGSTLEILGDLLNQLALYLLWVADYRAAGSLFERALHIDEVVFGPNHPNVAARVGNLGSVTKALGEYTAAKAHYERALNIDEGAFGPDHPNIAVRVNNLGSVLKALGDLAAAKAHYERALRIDEAVFGPDHPNVSIRVNNLGSVLENQGDHVAAKELYKRSLRIDEAAFGPDHPNVAIRVNNLGSVSQALREFAAAKQYYERALRIDEVTFGPNHPSLGRDVNNIGSVLMALGDPSAAKAHFERALRIFTVALGPDHPNTRIVQGNLDILLREHPELVNPEA